MTVGVIFLCGFKKELTGAFYSSTDITGIIPGLSKKKHFPKAEANANAVPGGRLEL
jgi:hypothetical protein